uniref:Unannotated protein n=1 Tax=freshwater metagenome TaxID=449393 RepID=A0A6J5ZAD4_9ZZZZ
MALASVATAAVAFALVVGGCGDKTEVVPNTVDQSVEVAQQMLSDKGFQSTVTRVTSNQLANEVLKQSPVGGTDAKTSEKIALTVSNGPGDGIVPDVAGDAADRAERELRNADFEPVVKEVYSSVHEAGFAVGTNPAAGTDMQKETKVTLNVSRGPRHSSVPDVIGLSENNADAALTNAGFRVDHAFKVANKTPGSIIAQDPVGGVSAAIGSSVQVVIDRKPVKVTVPNAVGLTQAEGDRKLQNAGLDAVYSTKIVSSASQNGIVLAESPGAGSKVNEGTNVALTIGRYKRPTPPVPPVPPGPSSIVKQFNLKADQTKTYTVVWSSGQCPGGTGNAVLSGDGGGSAMSGAQITDQGPAGKRSYYATTQTSDITSPVTLKITITCLVQ